MGARGRLIVASLGLVVLAGGAAYTTGIIHLPITCEGPPAPVWGDNPRGGVQVADLKEAAPYLAFMPIVPRGLGPAAKFFVGGNKPDMSTKSLIWWYDQPPYGKFLVNESITEATQAFIDSLNNNPTGCSLESVVTLRNGTRAALSLPNPAAHGGGRGTGGASIMWLDHGLLITANGYSDTFTKDRAIELANHF